MAPGPAVSLVYGGVRRKRGYQGKLLAIHNPHPLLLLVKEFMILCNLHDPWTTPREVSS